MRGYATAREQTLTCVRSPLSENLGGKVPVAWLERQGPERCAPFPVETQSGHPMSIKSDKWIRRMALEHGMIEPFVERQVRDAGSERVISYGVSSYGYDVRCADEFKVFTNIHSATVDPKNF